MIQGNLWYIGENPHQGSIGKEHRNQSEFLDFETGDVPITRISVSSVEIHPSPTREDHTYNLSVAISVSSMQNYLSDQP